jgi:hypothetical protein
VIDLLEAPGDGHEGGRDDLWIGRLGGHLDEPREKRRSYDCVLDAVDDEGQFCEALILDELVVRLQRREDDWVHTVVVQGRICLLDDQRNRLQQRDNHLRWIGDGSQERNLIENFIGELAHRKFACHIENRAKKNRSKPDLRTALLDKDGQYSGLDHERREGPDRRGQPLEKAELLPRFLRNKHVQIRQDAQRNRLEILGCQNCPRGRPNLRGHLQALREKRTIFAGVLLHND